MRQFGMVFAAALLIAPSAFVDADQNATAKRPAAAQSGRFDLTVDSIMRGPDLVGYPPTDLRWSADSQRLYFEWRRPGEDEASTYEVARGGGAPRKLSDDERKKVPPGNGRWDKARRRVLFVDGGDIVLVDAQTGTRRQITRTTGGESSPRWARNDTHVTFVRDGNLFIVPVDPGAPTLLTQLTDAGPRRPDPRLTDSQKFIREEEEKLLEYVKKQNEERKKREDEQKKDQLPKFELQERQTAADMMLSPDDTHVFILVGERPAGSKSTIVPNYVTETGYTEDIPGRTNVGDTQDRRLLAVLNLKTGKSVWADVASRLPLLRRRRPAAPEATTPEGRPGRKAERDIRWGIPAVSEDGKLVVASARSADNKERWFVTLDPESGKTKVVDHLRDDALDPGRRRRFRCVQHRVLPDNRRIWFLSERDGWMHVYTLDVAASDAKPTQLTSGKWEVTAAELSADKKSSTSPRRRFTPANGISIRCPSTAAHGPRSQA